MDRHGGDCLVRDYERMIPMLSLPDRDDLHVLAAAISTQAPTIVTFNVRDFPQAILQEHGITAMHPDAFVMDLIAENPDEVLRLARLHRTALRNPPTNPAEYVGTLGKCGMPRTSSFLSSRLDEI